MGSKTKKNTAKQRFEVAVLAETYKVIVAWGGEDQIRDALMAWNYPEHVDASGFDRNLAITFSAEGCYPVIALPKIPVTAVEIGTLAHEAVHAVSVLFDHLRTPVNEHTEEIFAQFVGAVVRQSMDKFRAPG